MPSPAFEKNNALTQVIRRAQEINASAGLPAGRSLTDQPVTVGSGTSVRSAAMNNPTPLSDAEVEERNARARELGIMEPGEEDGPYGSLAAAQAAGMPVELPDAGSSRQTAREFVGSTQFGDRIPTPTHLPAAPIVKLPDFRKVEGFDFFRNVLYIDGLEFEIPEVDVLAMKKYAVDLALDYVVKQLADALVLFGVPPALAQQTAESVKEGASHGAGEATEGVQEVRESGHQPEGTEEV